jgi:hypothetical protein
MPFEDKKQKLRNTHIELNRWILDQSNWREKEIAERADRLLAKATEIWVGPQPIAS